MELAHPWSVCFWKSPFRWDSGLEENWAPQPGMQKAAAHSDPPPQTLSKPINCISHQIQYEVPSSSWQMKFFTATQEQPCRIGNSCGFLLARSTQEQPTLTSNLSPRILAALAALLQKASEKKNEWENGGDVGVKQPESSTGCFEAISQNMWKRVGFAIVPSLF